jgi:phosphoribosyl-ATP pyrophosphohydrolase
MLIPSIDIMGGRAVQLVNGERFELDGGDPMELASRFSILGDIAVVDLDAALGKGDNRDLILRMIRRYPCLVGGGIRDATTATRYLDGGARAVMIGTKANPEFLSAFPPDRLIAALDARNGTVMTDGWRNATTLEPGDRAVELAPYVGGFLFTVIEREGEMRGADLEAAARFSGKLREAGFKGTITLAGGVTTPAEVATLDALGVDAQVGMALYKGVLDPAQALAACLNTDRPDGLWPTVVCDEDGVALGLVYSDAESLGVAIREAAGVYKSRTRGLWRKGASSGDSQTLLRIDVDCDRDALRFTVRLDKGGFCHRGSRSCFSRPGPDGPGGDDRGFSLLDRTVASRLAAVRSGEAPAGSYTARLFTEEGLLPAKLAEEAAELAEARGAERASEEAADLLYFTAVALARQGSSLGEAARVLDLRAMRLTRRPGNAKAAYTGNGEAAWKTSIH